MIDPPKNIVFPLSTLLSYGSVFSVQISLIHFLEGVKAFSFSPGPIMDIMHFNLGKSPKLRVATAGLLTA